MCAGSHGQTAGTDMRVIPKTRVTVTISTKDGWRCFTWVCPKCKAENASSYYPEDGDPGIRRCTECSKLASLR